jgi:hypothetical protein
MPPLEKRQANHGDAKVTVTFEKLRNMGDGLEEVKQLFLCQSGWHATSEFPDCCWRWTKKMPSGITVAVSVHDAISIEHSLQCQERNAK